MSFRHHFSFLLFSFGLLVFAPIVRADTVVDTDIVIDTTWTADLSPILIRGRERSDSIIRVANGATLTIEPGVKVQMERGMTLQVTSQCLRAFNSEQCILDRDDRPKRPHLISLGLPDNPIIFTSAKDEPGKTPAPGDWGSVIIGAKGSRVEWTHFIYGGNRAKRAFVEVGEMEFKNNLVAHSETTALYANRTDISGSVIRDNTGNGVQCLKECIVRDNFIADNGGAGILLDTLRPTEIKGNFIYKNARAGILSESNFSIAVVIAENFLMGNQGGIHIYRSNEDVQIERNNFLDNPDFAILSDTDFDPEALYEATGNWFGIDTGSSTEMGPYFVSAVYDVSDYAVDSFAFELSAGSYASQSYAEYMSVNAQDEAFFIAEVSREAIIGSGSTPGSLNRYAVELKNLTTKSISGVSLLASMPADQELLLCSAQTGVATGEYSLLTACAAGIQSDIKYENGRLVWQPKSVGALQSETLYFVSVLRPTSSAGPVLPRLTFLYEGATQSVSYAFGNPASIQRKSGSTSIAEAEATTTEEPTLTSTPTLAVEENPASVPAPTFVVAEPANSSLKIGTVSRQIVGGVLQYVLRAEDDGRYYILFNSAKWREIDDFTRGVDKDRPIAIYGDYYYNRYGVATGIKFTSFEVR